jgi:hypothetical protein
MSRIGSSTVVTPAQPLVTARKSVTVKIGNGDAPAPALAAPASMATGTAIVGHMVKVRRESLATESAKNTPSVPSPLATHVKTQAERSDAERAQRIFRDENGRIQRLVEDEDAPVRRFTAPVEPVVITPLAPASTAPAAAEEDVDAEAIRAILATMGYTGKVTKKIKAQVRGYIAERAALAR